MARRPDRPKARPKGRPTSATFENGDEPDRCRARARDGSRCKNGKTPGFEVCRMHGGVVGGGRPPIHGRYATSLQGRILASYNEAIENREGLLDMVETIALTETIVRRAATRVNERDTPEFRLRALELYREMREARDDPAEAAVKLGQLGQLLERGVAEDNALRTFADAAAKLSKQQADTWRIRLSAERSVSPDELVAWFRGVVAIIQEELNAHDARKLVTRITRDMLAGGHPGPPDDDDRAPADDVE